MLGGEVGDRGDVVEGAHRRRDDRLLPGRLSYDILGTVPVAEVEIDVRVTRPGRTIELVEATMAHAGRDIVRLRAWLTQRLDNASLEGTPLPRLRPPGELEPWDPTSVWPGGFIDSIELRRDQEQPGRARFWARTATPLLDEPVREVARFTGLLDIANGMTVRVAPTAVAFPNLDLTVHYLAEPRGEWVGFDTSVSFGATGLGLTSSIVHDEHGPVGAVAQSLTVRPSG